MKWGIFMTHKKRIVIIGAGAAGLTAGLEFLRRSNMYDVTIIEAENTVGGISRTLKHNGNCIDIGGHRFFSKDDNIVKWWTDILKLQGKPSKDDIILNNNKNLNENGPDPEACEDVFLLRRRISRILFLRKFFDYPLQIKPETFINMGLIRTVKAGFGFLYAKINNRKEISLEDFMINRFGKPLYEMFFEDYTKKVWGRHPSQIDAGWGAQRIKSLSLSKVLFDALNKLFNRKNIKGIDKNSETSLIESFIYPKYGPGQLWEKAGEEIEKLGGKIILNTNVTKMKIENNVIKAIVTENAETGREIVEGDYFISSMAVKDLVNAMECKDNNIKYIAQNLPYRDFITAGILLKKLKLKNKTKLKTVNNIVPDTWIYIQERDVKVGRLQIFNNWSPYLVKDFENTVWIGLEYFVNEGDELWSMDESEFIKFAVDELVKLDIINEDDVIDSVRYKIKKAYPAYFGTYKDFNKVKEYLNSINNLYCVGRNGQHRYNNMDHSMLTAFEAVNNIINGIEDKSNIWAVNSEEEYHETKK